MGDGLSSDVSGSETVLIPETKRKLKLIPPSGSDGTAAIMMDRNLGAYEAAVNAIPKDILTMSRNNGFHFQKWRKDPFPSSYTTQKLPSVYTFTLSADAPPKHIMNRYKPDGFHAIVPSSIGKGDFVAECLPESAINCRKRRMGMVYGQPSSVMGHC